MGVSTLEEIMQMLDDMSEAERERGVRDFNELQRRVKKMVFKARITVKSLRSAADKLDRVWNDCLRANAVGTTSAIIGGAFTIAGGIAAIMSAGAATPLLLAGMGFGIGAAGTKLGTGFVESSINSAEIKKAEKDLKETLECIASVQENVQWMLNCKEEIRLLFVYCLAMDTLKLSDPVLKLLQKAISSVSKIPEEIWHAATKLFAEVGRSCSQAGTKAGAQVAGQAGIEAVGQAGSQAAGQAGVQAAGQTGAQAAGQAGAQTAGQAGVQAAEQTGVQAAGQAGAQAAARAGGLIICFSIPFLVSDVLDLAFTIRDIIENKGSEAASFLRERADELEEVSKQ